MLDWSSSANSSRLTHKLCNCEDKHYLYLIVSSWFSDLKFRTTQVRKQLMYFCTALSWSQVSKHTFFIRHILWNIFLQFAQKFCITSTNESVILTLEISVSYWCTMEETRVLFFIINFTFFLNFLSSNFRRRLRNHRKFYRENLRGLWPPKLDS